MELKTVRVVKGTGGSIRKQVNLGSKSMFEKDDQVYVFKRPIYPKHYEEIFEEIIEAENRLAHLDKIDFSDRAIKALKEYKKRLKKELLE